MPRLTQLVDATRTVSVPFGAVTLAVVYRPGVVTPRLQKAISQAQRESDIDAGLLMPMAELIASWDLTDDDGETIKTTPDALSDVPAAVLLAILSAIGEDMAPNRSSAGPSSNGSSPTASSAPAPNGTRS